MSSCTLCKLQSAMKDGFPYTFQHSVSLLFLLWVSTEIIFVQARKKLSRTGEISSGTIAKNCFSSSLLNFCLIIYRKPQNRGRKMLCFFPLTILLEVFPRNQGKLPRQDPTIAITKIRVLGGSHWLKASRTSPCLIFL